MNASAGRAAGNQAPGGTGCEPLPAGAGHSGSAAHPGSAAPEAGGAPLVRLAAASGVATVTLSRPSMHNALVPEMLLDLCVALETAGRREDVRCLLLQADGADFSIGPDLRRLAREMSGPGMQAYAAELAGLLNQAMLTLMRLTQPVVARVQGRVEGLALGLVLAADVVIAGEDARFTAGQPGAGLAPAGGWTALLPRLAGARRAGAGLMLAREIGALEARDWGIVTEFLPCGGLQAHAAAAARRIAQASPAVMRNAKRTLLGDLDDAEAALEAERLRFVEATCEAEARERVERFLRANPAYPDEGPAA